MLKRPIAGSIPAHAGEPRRGYGRGDGGVVYPRPRGGTSEDVDFVRPNFGLSPPTRGNPNAAGGQIAGAGSIPAHAGEPETTDEALVESSVYPRPRGGTKGKMPSEYRRNGLSPPTRGNRDKLQLWMRTTGSIPAHAGEPFTRIPSRIRAEVYPRPRGGTPIQRPTPVPSTGLSPPTRGNPRYHLRRGAGLGSIPAHAGEPRLRARCRPDARVYPRPRGGTLK